MSTPKEEADRALRVQWLALMLVLSRDISAYRDEIRAVVLEHRPNPNRR